MVDLLLSYGYEGGAIILIIVGLMAILGIGLNIQVQQTWPILVNHKSERFLRGFLLSLIDDLTIFLNDRRDDKPSPISNANYAIGVPGGTALFGEGASGNLVVGQGADSGTVQMARDIQQSSINWDNKIIETYSSKYLARISKCSSLLKWRDLISKEETTLLESLPGMVLGLVEIQQKCDLLRVCKERMAV